MRDRKVKATLNRLSGWRGILRFAFGIVLVLLLAKVIHFAAIGSLLAGIRPAYFVLVLVIITVDRLMMALKWLVLLRANDVHIPVVDVVRTYYIGNFLGYFLPPTVGVDVARTMHLGKYNRDMPKIVSSIVIERMVGFMALAFFSLLAAVFAVGNASADLSTVIGLNIAVVLAGISAAVLSFYRPIHYWLFRLLDKRLPSLRTNKIVAKLRSTYQAYQEYSQKRASLALFTGLTLIETAIPVFMNYYVGQALGLDITFAYFVMIVPITLFIQRIPLLPSVIGIREAAFVLFFALAGMTAAQAFSVSAVGSFATLLAVTPGLAFYFMHPASKHAPAEQPVAVDMAQG